MPRWFAQVNKRIFNPREIKRGERAVLTHVGRSSGKTYQTPLAAYPVDGGYMFAIIYGAESDWVQNVFTSGTAQLRIDDRDVVLVAPQLYAGGTGWSLLPADAKRPPGILNITELLRMDNAS